ERDRVTQLFGQVAGLAIYSTMPLERLTWQPFEEPLRTTLARTGRIALVVGAIFAWQFGNLIHWPKAALLVLWLSFGGHWLEVWFLNFLRPKLPAARAVQVTARVAVWFAGGCMLLLGLRLTAIALPGFQPPRWPGWWFGGAAFIAIELATHLVLLLR